MTFLHKAGCLALAALVAGCAERELLLPGTRQALRSAVISPAASGEPGTGAAETAPVPVSQAVPAAGPKPVAIGLPAAQAKADWPQRGGNALHRAGHAALAATPAPLWRARVGQGNGRKHRISADPVVLGGRIFTLDSRALVTATGRDGGTAWQTDLTPASDRADDASGGGLAAGEGMVFATTGFGDLVALDATSGAVVWRQRFDSPVGGAPTVADGRVYVVARDASAWAVSARDGRVLWQIPGTPTISGVMGGAAPAVDARQVIFPFSSGQLIAVARDSGTGLWNTQLAGQRPGRAYAAFSDLTGDPVIADGTVYAGTAGGRLAAVDADTGLMRWSVPDGALGPVVVAGGAVFFVNDEDQLMRIDARTGAEVWRIDMPYFTKAKPKRRRDIIAHYGPVLAGGRLVVASGDGLLRFFDPVSGALTATVALADGATAAPVVAGGVLYVVDQGGTLEAFR